MLTRKTITWINNRQLRLGLGTLLLLAVGCGGSSLNNSVTNKYVVTKLVADTTLTAAHLDTNLVNAWGMSSSPTGPWWVSDNGTGLTTLYSGDGTVNALVVTVPGKNTANGPVTGQVFNGTSGFVVSGQGAAHFIFVTEDGILSAWNSGVTAVAESDQSASGAVYKGLAIATNGSATFLYAANFNSGMVDVFDSTFTKTTSFTDATIPTGYAPFGIQAINGMIYVAYAKQDAQKKDEIAGAGFGYIDVFNTDGTLHQRLVSNAQLNAPWGMALAPGDFGAASDTLLVGNFGDGKINAYNINNGHFVATLKDANKQPIVIDGLWGLGFGNGTGSGATSTLFFTAGPNDEANGLFGSVTASL